MTGESAPQLWAPALLDLAGLAYELRISARIARRFLASGCLPASDTHVTPGPRGRRWTRRQLLDWLTSHPSFQGGLS